MVNFRLALTRRDFRSALPNFLWLTDITEFRLPSGRKVYLSAIRDCFDSSVVAWRAGERPDAALANSTLEDACALLAPGERPVIHSDRGGHYRWPGWISICEGHGLARSMSAKGCSPDNAAMEGFFGLLKREFWHGRDWSGWTPARFIEELGGWIGRYNTERRSDALGGRTPAEFRAALWSGKDKLDFLLRILWSGWSGKDKLDFLLRILKRIAARIPLETCSPGWNACAPYCNRALCT